MTIEIPGSRAAIERVARALSDRLADILFVGAAAATLYEFGPRTTALRPTIDVDIVAATVSKPEYDRLIDDLRRRGVLRDPGPDEESTMCRYYIDGIKVDIVPMDEQVLGFTNAWYKEAALNALEHRFADDLVIRIIAPIYFVASKFQAFRSTDREGHDDYLSSHDIEDVIQVLFGLETLAEEIKTGQDPVHDHVRGELRRAIAHSDFRYAVESHFSGSQLLGINTKELLAELEALIDES